MKKCATFSVLIVALLTVGCAAKKPIAANLDPRLVGKWRPTVLAGRPLSDADAQHSLYLIHRDGTANLAIRTPLRQTTTLERLSTANGQLTSRSRLSGKRTTQPYKIEGDQLTIGDGETQSVFVRQK